MKRWLPYSLILCGLCGPPAGAATISAGDHQLLPNRPGQVIQLHVTGGEPVSGIDLFVQVGDGGPELARFDVPPGTPGPAIAGVELIQGTIFAGVSDQVTDIGSAQLKQTAMYTLALVGPVTAVPAEGRLATLRLDTSGLFQGSWDLLLGNVLPHAVFGGPHTTSFAGQAVTVIRNGSLTIATAPLKAGDATRDLVFDQYDIVQVLRAGKYLTGAAATWGEGDWDGAPGGSPGQPPVGNGRFDQADIIAALAGAHYLNGPYASLYSGNGPAAVAAVPEPAGLILALTSLVGLVAVIRSRVGSGE
jgi:hypothetical protein